MGNTEEEQIFSDADFPNELVLNVVSFVNPFALMSIFVLNKRYYQLANSRPLWISYFRSRYLTKKNSEEIIRKYFGFVNQEEKRDLFQCIEDVKKLYLECHFFHEIQSRNFTETVDITDFRDYEGYKKTSFKWDNKLRVDFSKMKMLVRLERVEKRRKVDKDDNDRPIYHNELVDECSFEGRIENIRYHSRNIFTFDCVYDTIKIEHYQFDYDDTCALYNESEVKVWEDSRIRVFGKRYICRFTKKVPTRKELQLYVCHNRLEKVNPPGFRSLFKGFHRLNQIKASGGVKIEKFESRYCWPDWYMKAYRFQNEGKLPYNNDDPEDVD